MALGPGGIIAWIIVGLIAGWLTAKVMTGAGYGAFRDIILGIIGAFIGGIVMRLFGVHGQAGFVGSIVVAFIGAVILVWRCGLRGLSTFSVGIQRAASPGGQQTLRAPSRYFPLVYLLFWTGLRVGEAVGLRWGDVDLRQRKLSVRRSRTLGEDNPPKTARSARTIPLRQEVIAVLRAMPAPLHRPTNPSSSRTKQGTRSMRSAS